MESRGITDAQYKACIKMMVRDIKKKWNRKEKWRAQQYYRLSSTNFRRWNQTPNLTQKFFM